METDVKIFLKGNKYVLEFKFCKFKGEVKCKNNVELDNAFEEIMSACPDVTFNVRFSQGALGRYIRDVGNTELLYDMGYTFLGYINYNIRLFYNNELSELIIIEEDGTLSKCTLN